MVGKERLYYDKRGANEIMERAKRREARWKEGETAGEVEMHSEPPRHLILYFSSTPTFRQCRNTAFDPIII